MRLTFNISLCIHYYDIDCFHIQFIHLRTIGHPSSHTTTPVLTLGQGQHPYASSIDIWQFLLIFFIELFSIVCRTLFSAWFLFIISATVTSIPTLIWYMHISWECTGQVLIWLTLTQFQAHFSWHMHDHYVSIGIRQIL